MLPSSIRISSTTEPAHLENFLEAAKGRTIVIEDKYPNSTGSIRFGVREKDSIASGRADEMAKTRNALYEAILAVLTAKGRSNAVTRLKAQVGPSKNCEVLFVRGTTQLQPEVLRTLFENNIPSNASLPRYAQILTPQDYLNFEDTQKHRSMLTDTAAKARGNNIAKASGDSRFADIFVKDFDRSHKKNAYTLEDLDGTKRYCHTLEEFADFVGPGALSGFQNGANLLTVVSALASQTFPLFLNAAILKSTNTPTRSTSGEPIFFTAKLAPAYYLKKMPDGAIKLTYQGSCQPQEVFKQPPPAPPSTSISLPRPGLVTITCDLIIMPNGDTEHGNAVVYAKGLDV